MWPSSSSVTVREEHEMRMSENRVSRRIFERKGQKNVICNILQVKPTGQINFEDVRVQRRIILEQISKTGCDDVGWINPA